MGHLLQSITARVLLGAALIVATLGPLAEPASALAGHGVLDPQAVGTVVNDDTLVLAPTMSKGYWLVASDGGVFNFGASGYLGSTGALRLAKPVVSMAATATGRGYWLVASDGGVFNFGDAGYFGSTGALPLARPVVGMAATGKGYWLVASDGGVFNFGDAGYFGSTGALRLAKPVVGMAATPTGKGYWLVASDGGVFNFGDAGYFGSTGALTLARPVVGMAATPTGRGYWLVASDGGMFSFGDAGYFGSTGALTLARPVVGMAPLVGPGASGPTTAPALLGATAAITERSGSYAQGTITVTFDQPVQLASPDPLTAMRLVVYEDDPGCSSPQGNSHEVLSGSDTTTLTLDATSLKSPTTYIRLAAGFVSSVSTGMQNAAVGCTAVPTT